MIFINKKIMSMSTSPGFYSSENDLSARLSQTEILNQIARSSSGGSTGSGSGSSSSGGSSGTVPSTTYYWILAFNSWDDDGIWVDYARMLD